MTLVDASIGSGRLAARVGAPQSIPHGKDAGTVPSDVTITIDGVTQDEATNGLGDGDTPIDAVINADGTVLLRAERSGKGNAASRVGSPVALSPAACVRVTSSAPASASARRRLAESALPADGSSTDHGRAA